MLCAYSGTVFGRRVTHRDPTLVWGARRARDPQLGCEVGGISYGPRQGHELFGFSKTAGEMSSKGEPARRIREKSIDKPYNTILRMCNTSQVTLLEQVQSKRMEEPPAKVRR